METVGTDRLRFRLSLYIYMKIGQKDLANELIGGFTRAIVWKWVLPWKSVLSETHPNYAFLTETPTCIHLLN